MVANDSPPIGLSHPTVDPRSDAGQVERTESGRCECNDCGYTVEIGGDLPPTCPDCGGALTRVPS
ncbi:hypothetical protein [Halorussus lipolyticus]|uniref:hypothetical protein n=1 Tax=Halorussus lipolyticus TaxID=3034024 RepID=UPI0023E8938E|nr:hypothetical protein [Halorussus sp. DT80]